MERAAATELSALAEDLGQVVFLNLRSGLDSVCIGRYDPRAGFTLADTDQGSVKFRLFTYLRYLENRLRAMDSIGAPGVCTAAMTPQKPPTKVKLPPLILPASGWPMVPVTA